MGVVHGRLAKLNPELDPNKLKIGTVITLGDEYDKIRPKETNPLHKEFPKSKGYSVDYPGYEKYAYDLFIALQSSEDFGGKWNFERATNVSDRDKSVRTGKLLYEFRNGTGTVRSLFGPSHPLTGAVKKSDIVTGFVQFAKDKFSRLTVDELPYTPTKDKQVVNYSGGFGLSGALSTNDYMGQFIGSYSGDAFLTHDGEYIIFILSDAKSWKSLTYRLGGEFERGSGRERYSNTYQKYIWFAPANLPTP